MLAETFHSVSDTGNQALLLLAMRLARRPAGPRHPFGPGPNVSFWAFVVSILLFTVGGAFSIWEGVGKFLHPHGEPGGYAWAYGVLGGALVFESMSIAVALRSLARPKESQSIIDYVRDNRDPTLPTVVLEDAAALASILLAAGGIALTQITGRIVWDSVASVIIGLTLIAVAIVLAYENYSLLLGESASLRTQALIRRAIESEDAVAGLLPLYTVHLAPEELRVAAVVDFKDHLTAAEIEAAVQRLHEAIRAGLETPRARFILIEPAAAPAAQTPSLPTWAPGGLRRRRYAASRYANRQGKTRAACTRMSVPPSRPRPMARYCGYLSRRRSTPCANSSPLVRMVAVPSTIT
jgi:cation diffusion facilitator family transporter